MIVQWEEDTGTCEGSVVATIPGRQVPFFVILTPDGTFAVKSVYVCTKKKYKKREAPSRKRPSWDLSELFR